MTDWSAGDLFEGHHPITVKKVVTERRVRSFRPGDLWVPLAMMAIVRSQLTPWTAETQAVVDASVIDNLSIPLYY